MLNLTDLLIALGTVLIAVSLIVAVVQLQKDHAWRKNARTIAFSTYHAEHLQQVIGGIEQYFGNLYEITEPIELKKLVSRIMEIKVQEDVNVEGEISYLLSRYEELGLAVEQGVADFDIARVLLGDAVRQSVAVFKEYIVWRRDVTSNPFLWEHAVQLASRIQKTQDTEKHEPGYAEKQGKSLEALSALTLITKATVKQKDV